MTVDWTRLSILFLPKDGYAIVPKTLFTVSLHGATHVKKSINFTTREPEISPGFMWLRIREWDLLNTVIGSAQYSNRL
jgi:hypothetical protein